MSSDKEKLKHLKASKSPKWLDSKREDSSPNPRRSSDLGIPGPSINHTLPDNTDNSEASRNNGTKVKNSSDFGFISNLRRAFEGTQERQANGNGSDDNDVVEDQGRTVLQSGSSVNDSNHENDQNSSLLDDDIVTRNEDYGDEEDEDIGESRQDFRSMNQLRSMFPGSLVDILSRGPHVKINTLIDGLSERGDPYILLETLNELNETLLIMDLMMGRGFSVIKLCRSIVSIINDPLLQEQLELQLVACRCLYNLVELNPEFVHEVVYADAVLCLKLKLMDISYIDLAEQALQTMEIISRYQGRALLEDNCLEAVLQFLDFFTIHAQRKALSITANAFQSLSSRDIPIVESVFPTVQRIATEYTDPQCCESAWLTIARAVPKLINDPMLLERLIPVSLIQKLCALLPTCLGKSTSNSILSFRTCLKLINSLTLIASASPKISLNLIEECKIDKTFRTLLNNYLVSSNHKTQQTKAEDKLISDPSAPSTLDKSTIDSDAISIEALMAAPKELVTTLLKLLATLLPYLYLDPKSKNSHDFFANIGTYYVLSQTEAQQDINEKKIELYNASNGPVQLFIFHCFPVIINIYSSTVDYDIRRLVIITVLRMINICDSSALHQIATRSRVTNLLASIVIQSKDFISKSFSKSQTEETRDHSNNQIKPYALLHGALLILFHLTAKSSDAFLLKLEREGLYHDIGQLLDTLKHCYSAKGFNLPSENVDSKNFDESGGNSYMVGSQMSLDENNDFENAGDDYQSQNFEQDDSECQSENGDGDEDEDEDEGEGDGQQISDGGHDSEDMADDNDFSYSSRRLLGNVDYALSNNGTSSFTYKETLKALISLCTTIIEDYSYSKGDRTSQKSPHLLLLENVLARISNARLASKFSFAQWTEVWSDLKTALGENDESNISSYELTASTLVDSLLNLFSSSVGTQGTVCQYSFIKVFCSRYSSSPEDVPLVLLVNKLQEGVSRSESFEIVTSGVSTVGGVGDNLTGDIMSSKASSMAKQLKMMLISTDKRIPKSHRQIVLNIHAIATFRSIEAFLKARMATFNRLRGNNSGFSALQDLTSDEDASNSSEEDNDSDYQLQFKINGEVIPKDATVYGAIYRSLQRSPDDSIDSKKIWSGLPHKVTYWKEKQSTESLPKSDFQISTNDTDEDGLYLLQDNFTYKILLLLKVLFELNQNAQTPAVSEALFLNFKVTAKLNRQLEEPLVVASGTLPMWCVHFTREFPFLFPLSTRSFFLKSVSFGYSRLIQHWQNRSNEENSRSDSDNGLQLGRPSRHKVRLSRKKLLQSSIKVLETYGDVPSILEIEYFGEEGTGLGPTLEFYANVSKEFTKNKLGMWRTSDKEAIYVNSKTGLFPRPIALDVNEIHKPLHLFKVLGIFVARSLLDSRIIDFEFNPFFFHTAKNMVLGVQEKLNRRVLLDRLDEIDPVLSKSLRYLLKFVEQYPNVPPDLRDSITVEDSPLSNLSLNYALPGYPDIELTEDGADTEITHENLEDYIDEVLDYTLQYGIEQQVRSFIDGFSTVFPYSSLLIFSASELVKLFGNSSEDWSYENVMASVHADHGYSIESAAVQNLIQLMSEFTKDEQRMFLQFLTGSPRLPIGGFKELKPQLTVVRKTTEDGLLPDNYLPSVMTCANYLKLPNYTNKEIMRQRIMQAIKEGAGAFLLS
ncbi:hypothetical protein LJB42_000093 [Komagataella kurtzmanii]|nr:hypothetical protein LJB42_000093 [Komagataella kurtzmanii]